MVLAHHDDVAAVGCPQRDYCESSRLDIPEWRWEALSLNRDKGISSAEF